MVKQRGFVAVIFLLIAWAPIHYALSRRYHIDHWRFAGFAMYARPPYQVSLRFSLLPAQIQSALGKDSARIDQWIQHRRLWGELAAPDEIAHLILERVDVPALTITVVTDGMEPGDDVFTTNTREYRYSR